ncbi:hypothetical protein SAMN04488040_2907 [Sulfitobacter marinus]|uniref:Transmembrane protein n=1 Tax=Sulfitobacter marinus TaxID=394264 RepID=A0A1I6UWN2_9RHOB|nr:hypothetical protein [Sulfitobacter marinus]SFT05784.1 hypothetical protein SAMN04488040_2907 [Sulfitobacter marinus]
MPKFLLMIVGLTAYASALFISNALLDQGVDSQLVRIVVVLIPMLPAAFICGVCIFAIRKLDEMQRKLQFEALALSFVGTALITFSYGFLEAVGFPRISMFAIWPLMAALWFVGVMIGRLRFG